MLCPVECGAYSTRAYPPLMLLLPAWRASSPEGDIDSDWTITKDGEPHFGLKEHVAVDCAPCNKDIEKDLRFNCILDGLESL